MKRLDLGLSEGYNPSKPKALLAACPKTLYPKRPKPEVRNR